MGKWALCTGMCIAVLMASGAAEGKPAARVLDLKPGYAVELRGENGTDISGQTAATPEDYETASVDHLLGRDGRYFVGSVAVAPGATRRTPPPKPGVVRFKAIEYPQGQTALVVENGYSSALTYHLEILAGGKKHKATVCLVKPHSRTIEHWPGKVSVLDVHEPKLIPWDKDSRVVCG